MFKSDDSWIFSMGSIHLSALLIFLPKYLVFTIYVDGPVIWSSLCSFDSYGGMDLFQDTFLAVQKGEWMRPKFRVYYIKNKQQKINLCSEVLG